MAKAKVVIIHGTYGHPDENWFPWLAAELKELEIDVTIPAFPTPKNQTPDSWYEVFNQQVGVIDSPTVLVGHSLGAAFILRLLERLKEPLLGTFLVCGFIGTLGRPEFDPLNASFFERPFNWDIIRENAGLIRVYNSDDDPYVALEKGQELAQKLGVEMVVIEQGGHLNTASGFKEFETLLDDLTGSFGWA